MASLVTTSRMQQCFKVLIDINYHEFLLLFYCCALLEIKLTTTTNMVILLQNAHKRAHLWGLDMGCLLWVRNQICISCFIIVIHYVISVMIIHVMRSSIIIIVVLTQILYEGGNHISCISMDENNFLMISLLFWYEGWGISYWYRISLAFDYDLVLNRQRASIESNGVFSFSSVPSHQVAIDGNTILGTFSSLLIYCDSSERLGTSLRVPIFQMSCSDLL